MSPHATPWPPHLSPASTTTASSFPFLPNKTLKTLTLKTLETLTAAPSSSSPPSPPPPPSSSAPPPRPRPRTPPSSAAAAPAVTDRVFMDFSICPSYFRSDRTAGDDLAACPEAEPVGRVVFGLYGKLLPLTVANFKSMCDSDAYKGTLVHKILQGQFFVCGRQGRRDKGEVRPPSNLIRNSEVVDPKAFQLKHSRPGTLSLCLSENDDYDAIKLDPDYRTSSFWLQRVQACVRSLTTKILCSGPCSKEWM